MVLPLDIAVSTRGFVHIAAYLLHNLHSKIKVLCIHQYQLSKIK